MEKTQTKAEAQEGLHIFDGGGAERGSATTGLQLHFETILNGFPYAKTQCRGDCSY